MTAAKVVLVTGANTGIGYQVVRGLCSSAQPYEIFLGGRSLEKAEKATQDIQAEFPNTPSKVQPVHIDLDDDDSIQAAAKAVKGKFGRLDALVNNAGALLDRQLLEGKLNMREMWTQSWTTNTVGTQIVTDTFVPLLLESEDPRLLFMASGTSSLGIAENNPAFPMNKVPAKGWPKDPSSAPNFAAYRSSKAGMNMMMRILKEDGVKVWSISPGYLATGLGGSQALNKAMGAGDPSVAGEFVREVLEGQRDGDVGKVILRSGVQPW